MTNKKNVAMNDILAKAQKTTANKTYEAEDKKAEVKSEPVKKENKPKAKVGRKKVDDKKKPRQVYLNDAEFTIVEAIAEDELIDSKTLLLKAVKKYIKDTQGKTLEELIKEAEEA